MSIGFGLGVYIYLYRHSYNKEPYKDITAELRNTISQCVNVYKINKKKNTVICNMLMFYNMVGYALVRQLELNL